MHAYPLSLFPFSDLAFFFFFFQDSKRLIHFRRALDRKGTGREDTCGIYQISGTDAQASQMALVGLVSVGEGECGGLVCGGGGGLCVSCMCYLSCKLV